MTLTVYGIKNCDSMKKTFQWLDANGIAYDFVDFKKQPPSADVVERWLRDVGDTLVNTRGPSYRQLPERIKDNFTGNTRIQAIVDKPTLIKRPLMSNAGATTVGFDPDRWTTIPNLLDG
jgi:arsenate reductase|tara:strand:+ start:334 stop:690 length:357 start_codon:yes stop_codon:yes gene_type:complete